MSESNGNGPVRVALYERVSTMLQAQEGYSLSGQLHELRERMEADGRTVVAEVEDAGEKRWMSDRPGLRRIRELAARGEIDEVWAWAWDRYGQTPVPETLAIELAEYEVVIRSLDDGGENLGGAILRAVGGVLSSEDQKRRVEKSLMGKSSKAREGKVLGAGFRPRFGFRYVRNEKGKVVGFAVDEATMPTVGRIFSMLADGEAIHAAQDALEREGVKAPGGGDRWSRATIRAMILDDVYRPLAFSEVEPLVSAEVAATLDPNRQYGISWYGKQRTKYASRHSKSRVAEMKDRSEWIAVPVPSSGLQRDVVDRARVAVSENRRTPTRGARFNELAGGVFFCGGCGNRMVPDSRRRKSDGKPYYSYRCETKHSRGTDACPLPRSYRAEETEGAVWDRVRGLLVEPEELVAALERMIEEERKESGDPERRERALRRHIEDLDRKIERAKSQAVRDLLAEMDLDASSLKAEVTNLASQREVSHNELESCMSHGGRLQQLTSLREVLVNRAESWSVLMNKHPDLGEYVVGPMPWENDPFAKAVAGDPSSEERHSLYRRLGLKVVADPEGGIRLEGIAFEGQQCGVTQPTSS